MLSSGPLRVARNWSARVVLGGGRYAGALGCRISPTGGGLGAGRDRELSTPVAWAMA